MKQQWTVVIETAFNHREMFETRLKLQRQFVKNLLEFVGLPYHAKRIQNGVWVGVKSIKERKKHAKTK